MAKLTHQDMLNFVREYGETCRNYGLCVKAVETSQLVEVTPEELKEHLEPLETQAYKPW